MARKLGTSRRYKASMERAKDRGMRVTIRSVNLDAWRWVRELSVAAIIGTTIGLCLRGQWADTWMCLPGAAGFLILHLIRRST